MGISAYWDGEIYVPGDGCPCGGYEVVYSENDMMGSSGKVTSVTAVPVPPAFYLFGSGLLALWRLRKPK